MKKLLIILSICFIAIQCLAGPNKKYKKIANKYDVPVEAIDLRTDNPSDFWNIILTKNEKFTKFQKDIKKNKGAEKEALSEWQLLPRFYPELKYANGVIDDYQDFCDRLLKLMGISQLGINCSLHVVNSPELNAYTALTNDGFVMLITTGLLKRKGFSYQHIMGIVAHEFTHGIYQHHLQQFYAQAKKKRKNELLSGIFQGIAAVSAGVGAYGAALGGAEYDISPYSSIISGIDENFESNTYDFFFVYGREQEYEADIVAFRFLEFMGYHSDYIGVLELLGTTNDMYYSKYSDHPKMQDRINLLEYMIVSDRKEKNLLVPHFEKISITPPEKTQLKTNTYQEHLNTYRDDLLDKFFSNSYSNEEQVVDKNTKARLDSIGNQNAIPNQKAIPSSVQLISEKSKEQKNISTAKLSANDFELYSMMAPKIPQQKSHPNDLPGQLYKELSKKYEVGEEQTFRKALRCRECAEYVYQVLIEEGYILSDFNIFEKSVNSDVGVPIPPIQKKK